MSMDADEFYLSEQIKTAKAEISRHGYVATACRMRTFFSEPIYEFCPADNLNAVSFICEIRNDAPFQLCAKYPIVLDPTRRIELRNIKKDLDGGSPLFHLFDRSAVEMYHMSFVRKSLRRKLDNVSNRQNYGAHVEEFLSQYENWTPEKGVLHPHPYMRRLFTEINVVPNLFQIDIVRQCDRCLRHPSERSLLLCTRCRGTRYCTVSCQKADWNRHKKTCKKK
eukprot:TRINITY_DN1496_c1_g1_i2.p1 TRINITY_DN1496_c1_g1~~TRINITY_DN1496_c1_g1_i2.p1  ORF type:complete len:223 (+),score=26.96 TRINITY_DN1496_c1_g1_i2:654-1322(+)